MDIGQFLILLCAFCASALLFYPTVGMLDAKCRSLWGLGEHASESAIQDLFIQGTTAREVIFYTLGGVIITFWVLAAFVGSGLLGLVGGIAACFLPRLIFAYLKEARLQKFEEQLPAALDQMVSSAKSGSNLMQAIEDVSSNLSAPVNQEFGLIVHNIRLGDELGSALTKARLRIARPGFDLLVAVLLVNKDSGGDLPKALEVMSASFIEIWRLEQKLVTASAEARKAVKLIAAMPFLIYLMVALAQPEMVAPLTASIAGYSLLAFASILYMAALWWLRKMLRIVV